MRMNVAKCGRCGALIHRGQEKKGCDRCGRISTTIGYERAIAIEREELSRLISRALKSENKTVIYLTRATA